MTTHYMPFVYMNVSFFVHNITCLYLYTCSTIVMYSRDHKGVGMAHKTSSPKNQPQFTLTTMRQYWLGKTKPKQALDGPEMFSISCYGIFNLKIGIFY